MNNNEGWERRAGGGLVIRNPRTDVTARISFSGELLGRRRRCLLVYGSGDGVLIKGTC